MRDFFRLNGDGEESPKIDIDELDAVEPWTDEDIEREVRKATTEDPIAAYLVQIGRYSLLSPQEEVQMGKDIFSWLNALRRDVLQIEYPAVELIGKVKHLQGIDDEDKARSELERRFLLSPDVLLDEVKFVDREAKKVLSHGSREDIRRTLADLLLPWEVRTTELKRYLGVFLDYIEDVDSFSEQHRKQRIKVKQYIDMATSELGDAVEFVRSITEEAKQHWDRRERRKQDLANGNLRLVVSIAKKYKPGFTYNTLLDHIQFGNEGLMKATEKWDHRLGYKFSTYATWWIRQAVTRGRADSTKLMRVPVHVYEENARVYRSVKELRERLGRQPTADEIVEHTGTSYEAMARMRNIYSGGVSLDMPLTSSEEEGTFGNMVEDTRESRPELQADSVMLQEKIEEVLQTLSFREQQVLKLRYGLNEDRATYTLEECGKIFGVTRERIRQIEEKAIRKLQHPLRSRLLEAYDADSYR